MVKALAPTHRLIPARFPAAAFDRGLSAFPDSVAIHCVISLSGRLDERRLARAVRLTLDAEPILGCRFVERWFRPYWQRYDSLDDVAFFELRESSDWKADVHRLLLASPDLPLHVLLLRGDTDLLCVKLDHRVGDGKALLDYAYLLADMYNRLADDPEFLPVANVAGARSLIHIGNRFSLREKGRIARHILKVARRAKGLGRWNFPVPEDGRFEFDYVSWQVDATRVSTIFEYACTLRATVTQVFLAAFFQAAYEELPRSTDPLLPIGIAVDLRRHMPSKQPMALCNLVGNSVIAIKPRAAAPLDDVLRQILDQMRFEQRYLGLPISFFAFEALPVIRHIYSLIPYGLSLRRLRKQSPQPSSSTYMPGVLLLTHVGEIDQARLAFGDVEATEAFATAGGVKIPGILGLAMSGFRGSLTVHLGLGPTVLLTRLRDRMMQILP